MALTIELLPLLKDNYAYLLNVPGTDEAAVVDPSVAPEVLDAVKARGWRLTHILNTHHHWDHTDGNQGLIDATGAEVLGPEQERAKIPTLGRGLKGGDTLRLWDIEVRIIATPGHTAGQIAYYLPAEQAAFTGDTLFALGCGRVFEGTAADMWGSMLSLRELPPDTRIYCGHEYTQSNCRFAMAMEPQNERLRMRAGEIERLRGDGRPTVPSTMSDEIATNPFLRADVPAMQQAIGMAGAAPVAVFAELRGRKDKF